MKKSLLWISRLVLIAFIAMALTMAITGCTTDDTSDESDDNDEDGDDEDGDVEDGDIYDGDVTDGDTTGCPDGYVWDILARQCVLASDGDVADGDTTDGDVEDGDVTDGDVTDGDVTDGDVTDGDVTDGDVTDGDVTDGDVTDGDATCDSTGFTADNETAERREGDSQPYWIYNAVAGTQYPIDLLGIEIYPSYGAPSTPGTYELPDADYSYDTCGLCLLLHAGCSAVNGQLQCDKVFMPKTSGPVTITSLGDAPGDSFNVSIKDVVFQEVTINPDNLVTTPVPGGDTWCLDEYTANKTLDAPGFVDMDPPDGLSCEYPEGPYYFYGPEPGDTETEPGTVPPMGWPSAYFGGEEVGFNLAEYHCDHPEVKTLFIFISAGWCSACASWYRETVCPEGGLLDALHAQNAEVLHAVVETNNPGTPATSSFAESKINGYGCEGGYRIADNDNTAGEAVIYRSPMYNAFPWAVVIDMKTMTLMYEQGDEYWLDFVMIARSNNTD